MICAGSTNLTHNVYLNGAGVANGELYITALIARSKCRAQLALSASYGKAAEIDRTIARNGDSTLGRNGVNQSVLTGTIYINYYLVARTKHIVIGNWHISIGLEAWVGLTEDVATEHALAVCIGSSALSGLNIVLYTLHLRGGIVLDGTSSTYTGGGELLGGSAIAVALHALGGHSYSTIGSSTLTSA